MFYWSLYLNFIYTVTCLGKQVESERRDIKYINSVNQSCLYTVPQFVCFFMQLLIEHSCLHTEQDVPPKSDCPVLCKPPKCLSSLWNTVLSFPFEHTSYCCGCFFAFICAREVGNHATGLTPFLLPSAVTLTHSVILPLIPPLYFLDTNSSPHSENVLGQPTL